MTQDKNEPQGVNTHRWKLAITITVLSILGISIITAMVIIFADDKSAATQTVLTATLPLLAAWVSTVLAYYYSSESVEAATKSVKALMSTEEKLESIKVSEKMLKVENIQHFLYSDELQVQNILDTLKKTGKGSRLPFLNEKMQAEYMLHKSAIDEALLNAARNGDDITKITLKGLFDKEPGLKTMAENLFGIVGENATLAEAKTEMTKISGAQDVFVTDNGSKEGKVVGWITNTILEQSSKV